VRIVVLFVVVMVGCAHQKPKAVPYGVLVFKTCAHNGDRMVCECDPKKFHEEYNAVSKQVVGVCE
jgi:hypothetical protein